MASRFKRRCAECGTHIYEDEQWCNKDGEDICQACSEDIGPDGTGEDEHARTCPDDGWGQEDDQPPWEPR